MIDFTKCTNNDCPIKEYCARFNSKSHEHNQYYQRFEFEIIGGNKNHIKCDMFWSENQTDILTQLEDITNGKNR